MVVSSEDASITVSTVISSRWGVCLTDQTVPPVTGVGSCRGHHQADGGCVRTHQTVKVNVQIEKYQQANAQVQVYICVAMFLQVRLHDDDLEDEDHQDGHREEGEGGDVTSLDVEHCRCCENTRLLFLDNCN